MPPISITDLCNDDSSSFTKEPQNENSGSPDLANTNEQPQLDSQSEIQTSASSNEHFMARVSNFPIVNTALRAYENTKASSSVVKYSAETVESSVKTIWGPVISHFEPRLEKLDGFACRQLDKLERTYTSYTEYSLHSANSALRQRKHKTDTQDTEVFEMTGFPQSRWKKVVVNAGAGVAFVSEESMKKLRYCLEWLQYASAHISRQTAKIHNYIRSLCKNSKDLVTRQAKDLRFINSIKHEIVQTLRQVVDVIGRYAGSCLPGEACTRVRNFILSLPSRWASLNVPTLDNDSVSVTSCSSAVSTPIGNNQNPSEFANEAIQRLLLLANESSQLVHNVKSIFKETVDRADTWSDAISGLKRFANNYGMSASSHENSQDVILPPISSVNNNTSEKNSVNENAMEVDTE